MIERLIIKNQLSFKEVDITFGEGLIVFTGPSGTGKSVFMQGILSLFGQAEANASSVEAVVTDSIRLEEFGLQSDDINIFKYTKEKAIRYFINGRSVSKKSMLEISKTFLSSLAVRDSEEFENQRVIRVLDALIAKKKPLHAEEVSEFEKLYFEYKELKDKLEKIEQKEKKIEELKEFASFEISKIDEISPKIGEDEELMSFKRSLSKKEKIEESASEANEIFAYESRVSEFLTLVERDSSFFDESMNELRAIIEEEVDRLNDLEEQDVDALLERIEKISALKSRYGSIQETLEYKEQKVRELEEYDNISFEKEKLISVCKEKLEILDVKSKKISKARKESLGELNSKIDSFLDMLYMPKIDIVMSQVELYELGVDSLHVELGRVNIKKISSGEYNRLRLAFIATSSEYLMSSGGVLILDEIDANLSGKESMSVAKVLKILSKKYQIFAISHQPQLSSQADSHFLITKDESGSKVVLLSEESRVVELARMVSGEDVSGEAIEFAKKLLG